MVFTSGSRLHSGEKIISKEDQRHAQGRNCRTTERWKINVVQTP